MSDSTQQIIQALLHKHPVVLFMKGTVAQPYCGFSQTVAKILTKMRVEFHSVDVMQDEAIRQGIKEFSQWPTIPQLYVNQTFIGGCDIVQALDYNGELDSMLKPYIVETSS